MNLTGNLTSVNRNSLPHQLLMPSPNTMSTTESVNNNEIVKAVFEKEPPSNLRKSNFFHFVLTLFDKSNNAIEVEKGLFTGFPSEEIGKTSKNGLMYRLHLITASGNQIEQDLLVELIDSQTGEIICYEGQDKNPELCRVLLTHEVTCSRCCEKKSCGNRNETPSDCIVLEKYYIKFFMKCNQNCLKCAGNPRDVRRFKIAVSTNTSVKHIASSTDMFVHNNSKHGRRISTSKAKMQAMYSPPKIKSLIPSEGWTSGGSHVIAIGENFFDGLQIVFGNCLVWSVEVFSQTALRVVVPPYPVPCMVEVVLAFNSRPIFHGQPACFIYNSLSEPSIDFGFQRLTKLLPRHPGDPEKVPKEIILKRAGDMVESLYSMQCMHPSPLPSSHSLKNSNSSSNGYISTSAAGYYASGSTYPTKSQPRLTVNVSDALMVANEGVFVSPETRDMAGVNDLVPKRMKFETKSIFKSNIGEEELHFMPSQVNGGSYIGSNKMFPPSAMGSSYTYSNMSQPALYSGIQEVNILPHNYEDQYSSL